MPMTIPPLPETLIPMVSALAWFAVNWLKHSPLKLWVNALIALGVPPVIALIWALTIGAFLHHSLWQDIAIIVLLSYAALALPELAAWRQWLQDTLTSPLALVVPSTAPAQMTATTAPVTPYTSPRAMELPSRATPYPIDLPSRTTPYPALRTPLPAPERQGLLSGPLSSPGQTAPMATTTEPTEEPPTSA